MKTIMLTVCTVLFLATGCAAGPEVEKFTDPYTGEKISVYSYKQPNGLIVRSIERAPKDGYEDAEVTTVDGKITSVTLRPKPVIPAQAVK